MNTANAASPLDPVASEFFDGSPIPTFAIDAQHHVTQWNKACALATGIAADTMMGTKNQWKAFYREQQPLLADLVLEGEAEATIQEYYKDQARRSPLIPGAWEVEGFFPDLGENGRWLYASAAPVRDSDGKIVGAIEILQDITKQKLAEHDLQKVQQDLEDLVVKRTSQLARANGRLEEDIRRRESVEAELTRRNTELTELNQRLSIAQQQLMQSEKLASIGQLAAGVAHEINNPISYIFSNFGTLEKYLDDLLDMLAIYEKAEPAIGASALQAEISAARERIELEFLKEDIPVMMNESREGIIRVRKIVQDLKDFSHVDAHLDWQWVNLHAGIDSTLNIVANEVKYRADVVREYGQLPEVECLPSEINQVIMNLVVNAAHAMDKTQRGRITIRTGVADRNVWIEVGDNGCGIPKENLSRIFDPFFTTKPIGSGTGLGLSLSYGIIQKHAGTIEVDSSPGTGTTFRITLPIEQAPENKQSKVKESPQ